ncbi:efflux RND transporter periplasmic adaptor subunit [Pontixanthobacter sp.]|uniref:efflux RND transporter periplasmic adaptor subunit n=1 Tax=Pontixanthobacter sp. TaxID=2792078 RepID=UPI003C7D1AE7
MNYATTVRAETAEYSDEKFDMSDARTQRSKLPIIILLIALLLGLIAGAYYYVTQGTGAVPAGDDREGQAAAISVIAPGQTTIEGRINAVGTLAARRELPVGVAGEGGRVTLVSVDAGDWVRAGQVLAVIDRSVQNQQVASSSAQVEVSRADANLAQANLDRALKLVERGFISKADIDRLTATRDAASARVKVAQAQVGELRARNSRLNIIAPASGLVLERMVQPGQVVSAGSGALFRIAQGGEMEMMAQLSEVDLAALSTGLEATIVPTGSDKNFTGQIWQISPVIDPQSRQGTARIALPYAPELRPGGFANATIASGTLVAPMLPESAILSDDDGAYVFVVGADNKAQRRRVKTGLVTAQGIAVMDGLTGREKVVLRAGGFLTEGELISPQLVDVNGKPVGSEKPARAAKG